MIPLKPVDGVVDQLTIPRARELEPTAAVASGRVSSASPERASCFHCGEPCVNDRFARAGRVFCCQGCLVIHDLLSENGLGQFYGFERHPGVRVQAPSRHERWVFLDEPALQERLLDFTDGRISRVTLKVPAIHCVACVWLLENLYRLNPGVTGSRVNFPRREVAISFDPGKLSLSRLVGLLASIGYEPQLTLNELEKAGPDPSRKRRWLQVGVAGFAFGNIMLLSLPAYLGLDSFSGELFKKLFGYLSLALAAPAVVYSASDYWRSALLSFRQRVLTLDVPIALGLAALFIQSAVEIVSGRGAGYLDSLAGLVFFLLCGRAFQKKTHERIEFDRDYKSFFPLAVTRKSGREQRSVAISELRTGDRVLLRNGEMIPADSRLIRGSALIDYSFVTGESAPIARESGDYLYAGGKQIGGEIELETVKRVSQSYLTSLWNNAAFRKQRPASLDSLTDRYSRRFTRIVVAVAAGAALVWWFAGNEVRAVKAFTSVLIVACPCALALAAPFSLGTAQRRLANRKIFLKNSETLERMAEVDAIVFDKTGTLTEISGDQVMFHRAPGTSGNPGTDLTPEEETWVQSLARLSTHPHSVCIAKAFKPKVPAQTVLAFKEVAGCGIEGIVDGHEIRLGSPGWLGLDGAMLVRLPASEATGSLPGTKSAAGSCLLIDGEFRGFFVLHSALRPDTVTLLSGLTRQYELTLLSGDNAKDRDRFRRLFGTDARMHFNQSPLDKLGFIRGLQNDGRTVMMVGDGLNDAGALQQSDVGVAVVEKMGVFSPASDVILDAEQVAHLPKVLNLCHQTKTIVQISFGISALYNVVGISIAAIGMLSPLICAVLMPLSSVSVVLFACGATDWAARRTLSVAAAS